MSDEFRAELARVTSKKGWVEADYDERTWVPCPRGLPAGWTPQRWAEEFAAAWWALAGLPHDQSDLDRLSTLLAQIWTDTWGPDATIACHLVFIHLPDPRMLPLPVYLAILEAAGDRETELRRLARADDPAALEPPIVDDFHTDRLGPGLRVLRHWRGDDEGEVDVGLSYAWRSEAHETDLRLFTATNDLGRLQQALPDTDDLARQITVVASTA